MAEIIYRKKKEISVTVRLGKSNSCFYLSTSEIECQKYSLKYMRQQKMYRILHQRGWKETSLERKIIKIITTCHSRLAKAD